MAQLVGLLKKLIVFTHFVSLFTKKLLYLLFGTDKNEKTIKFIFN